MGPKPKPIHYILILCCFLFSACTNVITGNVIQPAIGNLQQQSDIELVCDGAPAYLLMLDSMLVSSPDNSKLLLTAAQSFSAYATALAECGEENQTRISAIAAKAKQYGQSLLTQHFPLDKNLEEIEQALQQQSKDDVEELFWGTYGWLTWIQSEKGSPASIADVVIIEKIMARLLALDPAFQGGSIHVFFGTYYAAKPTMFGGRPDLSRSHFEKALTFSQRKFLLTQTSYATTYARITMDQDLHDSLLKEVMSFEVEKAPEFLLSNRIAQRRAEKLLAENYFGDE